MPVVGYFAAGSPERFADRIAAFREGLRKTGFVEGRNVEIEQRWSDAGFDSMPALATELVAHKVDVLVTSNAPTVAKAATTSIPIVSLFAAIPLGPVWLPVSIVPEAISPVWRSLHFR